MDTAIDIRRAEVPDAERIAVLAMQVWLDTYAVEGIRSTLADYVLTELTVARVKEQLTDPASVVFVGERSGHLVAFSAVVIGRPAPSRSAASPAEIERLYVQEPFCNVGIGRRLLGAIEELGRTRRITELWLKVWVHNARARRFYARNGFADIGTSYFRMADEQHENRVLAKLLQDG